MWPPGAYKADRTTLPYPPYGTLNYFDQTASSVLERIYSYRKTAILPAQTGPVTDVLYSAAGNSADEAYYNHGIIGYDFEIGATKRLADGTTASPGFQPPFGAVPIGGNPSLANEGHDEGMEFSQRQLRAAAVRARLRQRHDRPVLRGDRRDAVQRSRGREVHDERGGLDLLHDGRLDADHGLHRVEAEPAARAAGPGRARRQHDAEVDRGRLQGQHLRGAVEDLRGRPGQADGDVHQPGRRRRDVHAGPPGPADVHLRGRELRRRQLRRLAGAGLEPRHVDPRHVHLLGDREGQRRQRGRRDPQLHGHPGHERRRRPSTAASRPR